MERIFLNFKKVSFVNRPIPVPYNYRVIYKVSQIILIIGETCKRGGCSLPKLHIISNALASNKAMKDLEDYFSVKKEIPQIIRFEPALTRAINYGIAESLLELQSNGKIKLTENGKVLYKELIDLKELMVFEKIGLNNISNKINDNAICELIKKWSDA